MQPRAERDISEAFVCLAERAPGSASRWHAKLKAAVLSLGRMPPRCASAPEADALGICVRQLIFGQRTGTYRIVFVVREDLHEVHVLTVRHAARKPIELRDIQ